MKLTGKVLLAGAAVIALSGSAMAADLYVPPPAAPAPVAAATNWDGPYIGANIGYGWGSANVTAVTKVPGQPGPAVVAADSTSSPSGFMIGGQIGYNFHLSDNVVGGVEGSLDWNNQHGLATTPFTGTINESINWDGRIVGRLGLDLGTILPYVDAGVAFANTTRDATGITAPTPGTSVTNTQVGWTAGVGVEAMLSDHLSGFVAYNYSDYGNADYKTSPNYVNTVQVTDSAVKAGLNFHF